VFDVIFLTQHYVLYPDRTRHQGAADRAALRRVRAVLRALAAAPERLPFDVAEDALLSLGEAGVDVNVQKELQRYADHPEDLPPSALGRLLSAYWCAGGALGVAREPAAAGGPGAAWLPGGLGGARGRGLREPLLPRTVSESWVPRTNAEGLETVSSSEAGSFREPEVEIVLGHSDAAAEAGISHRL